MSKAGAKPRASEPVRRPSGQVNGAAGPNGAIQRKASGPAAAKFYSGPTVPAPSAALAKENVKQALDKASDKVVKGAKTTSKTIKRTARRHPYSLISLSLTLPSLLFFSLFSTVLCPHPSNTASWASRRAHSLLGLPTAHPWRDTLCAPAYAYHDAVLEPLVYPYVASAQAKVESHPIYQESVIPAYTYTSNLVDRAWEGPIKPVVQRISNGARRMYLTFVEPHIPYVRARFHELTAPYIARVQAEYQKYVEPHLNTAQVYSLAGAQAVRKGYNDVSEHRITRQAQKGAMRVYRQVNKRARKAYVYARPRVIAAYKEAQRREREQVRPALVRALKAGLEQLDKVTAAARAQVAQQYRTHLHPHLSPYLTQAQRFISPYTTLLLERVYNPYIRPTVECYFPPPAKPAPPRSFWQIVSDFLPATGLHAAEERGRMYGTDAKRSASASASSVGKKASTGVKSATKQAKTATKDNKASAAAASKAAAASASSASAQAAKSAAAANAAAVEASKVAEASASSVAAQVKSASKDVAESVTSVTKEVKTTASSASKVAESVVAAAGNSASSVTEDVKSAVSTGSASAASAASSVGENVVSAASQASNSASSISTDASSAVSTGTESAKSAASSVSAVAAEKAATAEASVSSGVKMAKDAAGSATEAAASAASSASSAVGNMPTDKAGWERAIGALVKRIEGDVAAAEKELVNSIVNTYTSFQAETFPQMHSNNKAELAKDIDYVLGGLDKLYSSSTALTEQQVRMSGTQAEARVQKKHAAVRQRGKEVKRVLGDMSRPYLISAEEGLQGLREEVRKVEEGAGEGVRGRVEDLQDRIDQAKKTFQSIHSGSQSEKAITSASSKLSAAVNELSTELDDMFEGFREQVKLYQRVALSKVAARSVVQASPAASASAHKGKAEEDRASILPIVPPPPAKGADNSKERGAAEAGEPIIGKGKEQVLDALSDILSSAARKQTQVGAAERVMSSARSAQASAVSAGKETVRMQGQTVAAAAGTAASSASKYAEKAGASVTEGVKRAVETVQAGAEKVAEEGQDAMESLKSVYSEASAAATATAAKVGEGKVREDAARVAEQAMAHDEL